MLTAVTQPHGRPGAARRPPNAQPAAAVAGELPDTALRSPLVRQAPPGSVPVPPLDEGDQGVSRAERQHVRRVTDALLEAAGVAFVVTYLQQEGVYEIRSRAGALRFRRVRTPDGRIVFELVSLQGRNPIPSTDPRAMQSLEEELAALQAQRTGSSRQHVSYPDVYRRIAQLFDHRNAPDLLYVPKPGADLNPRGSGSHSDPDVIQSRTPLIMAGPGIARGAVTDALASIEDIAPTIADMMGVQRVTGVGPNGERRRQWLRWQDGDSLAPAVRQARAGAQAQGEVPRRALVIAIDGASQTALLDEVRRGRLPNIERLMRGGTTFANGSIVQLPTVTWANHNTLVTGATPGHHGIVNNFWYDRAQRTSVNTVSGSIRDTLKTSRHLEPRVETIYEAVERTWPGSLTLAANQPGSRGATVSSLDLRNVGRFLSGPLTIARHAMEGWRTVRDPRWTRDREYRRADIGDNLATTMVTSMVERGLVPRFAAVELAIVDGVTHLHGPHSEIGRAALRHADANVGRILRHLDARGLTDSTMVVLTGDHGMETQDRPRGGGWKEAIAASGVRTVEDARFVYVRTMRVAASVTRPEGDGPQRLVVQVRDDDRGADGRRPAVRRARVRVYDVSGRLVATGTTGRDGRVMLRLSGLDSASVKVVVDHADFTTHEEVVATR